MIDVIRELESFNVKVDIVDPYASHEEVHEEYELTLKDEAEAGAYDVVIAAVNHQTMDFDEVDFRGVAQRREGTVIDVKGVFRGKTGTLDYWSL